MIWVRKVHFYEEPGKQENTTSQIEVDFILGENEVTIETKSTSMVNPRHLKGLKSFAEEYKVRKNEKSPL